MQSIRILLTVSLLFIFVYAKFGRPSSMTLPTTPMYKSQKQNMFFVYPGAMENKEFQYESSDDPEIITQWYIEKITSMGMTQKNFLKSKSNGNTRNVLTASGNGKSVHIEILKKVNDTLTKIQILNN